MSRGAQNAILRRIALEISHKMTLQQKKKILRMPLSLQFLDGIVEMCICTL